MARYERAIPPGGEGDIVLKLSTRGYQGKLSKSAVVYSNDPQNPQIQLTVQAQIKTPISFQPLGVMLGGFVGDDIKQLVTITAHKDQPLILEPSKLSLPEKVEYELKTIEEGRAYQVVLRNISTKEDKYSGYITLKTNYPEKPEITIRFLGYVRGNLILRPETINFGRIETTRVQGQEHSKASYQRSVMVMLHRGDNLKIEKIEINQELFETQVKEIQGGKSYQIEVKLLPDRLQKGVIRETMKVYTNLKDNPVKVIPIRVQKM